MLYSASMRTALIGHTGLVGCNLRRSTDFSEYYNSSNIQSLDGHFDLLVCAGARGTKWLANQDPGEDRASINNLMTALKKAAASRLVLISSVDVFGEPRGVDESTEPFPTHPYGKHRLDLEKFATDHFPRVHRVRLPGLYGVALKKNPIFDILHDHELYKLSGNTVHQYYWLRYLWEDLQIVMDSDLDLIHIATEPVKLSEIAYLFGKTLPETESQFHYDMQTRYASHWGRTGRYLYSRDETLRDLSTFGTQQGELA